MNKLPIIVLDFSGVYDFEAFASSRNIICVDCKDLKGVDCYCDEEGREKLHRRLAPYPSKAIHFLDSGDFHYLTEYWVSRLQEPFSLIQGGRIKMRSPPKVLTGNFRPSQLSFFLS